MNNEDKEYRLIPYTEDDETHRVNLMDLISVLWQKRRLLLSIISIFLVYGILRSLATSEEFTSTSSMMPNIEEGSQLSGALQQFSGLLGSAGINPGSGSSEIDASLYPEIVFSTPSMYNLIYSDIYSPDLDSTLTVKDYMLEHRQTSTMVKITGGFLRYTVHLPFTIIGKTFDLAKYLLTGGGQQEEVLSLEQLQNKKLTDSKNISHRRLTVEEYNFIRDMKDKITITRDSDTGLFSVEVSMPEPEISAQVTQTVVDYLTNYIIEYRTEKLVRNLEFIEASYIEAEKEFKKVQDSLADFRDRNLNISTARMFSEEQRLESEYQLKFDLLNGIAQKREEARINLEEKTPVFKILEPVSVPTARSKPARVRMTITFIFLGFVVAVFWIFIRYVFIRNRT